MSKVLLITGATGKQGGAVINALIQQKADFTILAVTRNPSSASAQKLVTKSEKIKLVKGDLNNVKEIFEAAREVTKEPIWGVYSVQISEGNGASHEGEIRQGKSLVDESIAHGVEHFVYSSVERGGDEESWSNPTPIPHFSSKFEIEQHLRTKAGTTMGWTILRPVAFMDNLSPGFPAKVFMAALRDTLKGKPLQWVAVADVGFFAATAFTSPTEWNHRAIGLAGDELTQEGVSEAFEEKTGSPLGATYGLFGSALKWAVPEVGLMVNWFASDGYRVNIAECRKINPQMMDMDAWLESKNNFKSH